MQDTLIAKPHAESRHARASTARAGGQPGAGAAPVQPLPSTRVYDDAAQRQARRQLVQRVAELGATGVDRATVHAAARAGVRTPAGARVPRGPAPGGTAPVQAVFAVRGKELTRMELAQIKSRTIELGLIGEKDPAWEEYTTFGNPSGNVTHDLESWLVEKGVEKGVERDLLDSVIRNARSRVNDAADDELVDLDEPWMDDDSSGEDEDALETGSGGEQEDDWEGFLQDDAFDDAEHTAVRTPPDTSTPTGLDEGGPQSFGSAPSLFAFPLYGMPSSTSSPHPYSGSTYPGSSNAPYPGNSYSPDPGSRLGGYHGIPFGGYPDRDTRSDSNAYLPPTITSPPSGESTRTSDFDPSLTNSNNQTDAAELTIPLSLIIASNTNTGGSSDTTADTPSTSTTAAPLTLTALAKRQLQAARDQHASTGSPYTLQAPTMAVGRYRTSTGEVLKTSNQRNLPGTAAQSTADNLTVIAASTSSYPNMHGEMLGVHHHLTNALNKEEGRLVEMGASQEICFQCELILKLLGIQYDETHVSQILYSKWEDPTGRVADAENKLIELPALLGKLGISVDDARNRLVARLSRNTTAENALALANRILGGELQAGAERQRLLRDLKGLGGVKGSKSESGARGRARASKNTKKGRKLASELRKQRRELKAKLVRKNSGEEDEAQTPKKPRRRPDQDDPTETKKSRRDDPDPDEQATG